MTAVGMRLAREKRAEVAERLFHRAGRKRRPRDRNRLGALPIALGRALGVEARLTHRLLERAHRGGVGFEALRPCELALGGVPLSGEKQRVHAVEGAPQLVARSRALASIAVRA